jgi:purine nucleosidase
VTVTNNGAGLRGRAIRHARCVLKREGLERVPVADGSAAAPHTVPSLIRTTVDKVLGDVFRGCPASEAPARVRASSLIRRALRRHPRAEIIATGPLSNVAAALPAKGKRLTVMAGAVRVPGNLCCEALTGHDNTQEFNAWIDPAALRATLRAYRRAATLVPLDATADVPITREFIDRLGRDRTTMSARLVHAIVSHPALRPLIDLGVLYWWDPLAAAEAVHHDLTSFDRARVDVRLAGPQVGRTFPSASGRSLKFATSAATRAFERRFIRTLNGSGVD